MNDQVTSKCDLIVACIGNNEFDENIINIAYKESRLANCKWQVLHINERKEQGYLDSKVQRLSKKASILKAEVISTSARSIAEGIIKHAQTFDTKKQKVVFYIGTHKSGFWRKYLSGVNNQVKDSLGKLGIIIRAVQHEHSYNKNYTFISPIFNFDGLSGMLEAVISVLIGFLACFLLKTIIPQPNMEVSDYFLIYMIACIVASVRGGIIPGMIAAVLSLLSINFFFLKAEHNLRISNPRDVSTLLFFFAAAISASLICSGTRKFIIQSRRKEAYLNALLNVSETLNRPLQENEALIYIHHELRNLFNTEVAFYTPTLMDSSILQLAYAETDPNFSDDDKKSFDLCLNEYRSTGHMTTSFPDAKWYFEPMVSASHFQGILAVKLALSPLRYDNDIISILLGFADLSATIIDRIEHTQILEETRVNEEKEKLRTMLLSSVSHDLKTPLASIIGSLDVYHNLQEKLAPEAKEALTQTALQEAQRLDSFITNILDMAKLESGSIKFNKDWHRVETLVDRALTNSRMKLGKRKTKHVTDNNYEVEIDHNMMLRALANLFDNISKYTPESAGISIQYGPDEDGKFSILIQDSGPGIAEDMLEQVFNKYTRIKKQDSSVAGTGLGLPISRSIIESHGGNIIAFNGAKKKGAAFKITLPTYRVLSQ